ncbi:tetratricopeptide (TPR) repeat protein [Actinoplanes tereljensis]|uniref:toll/interleukin-1 receptor domain-containing protein n=1 Tax=Paractinoplanes tereljensis TaxID=571912 RepID=UPI00194125E5|nr:toll/interleukin-1 receptor domain-containing protein [Actinoplanes tereljensis]
MERRDFFVSYTQADRVWAEWIGWQLEEAGFSVLLQAWDMVPGSNWLRMMNQGTRFAERTIAVVSDAYLNDSEFGEAEWLAAFRHDPQGLAGRLIPIRVEDCVVDGLLAGIVHADLFGMPDETAQQVLLDTVRAAAQQRIKPLTAPAFPGGTGGAVAPVVFAAPDYLAQVRQIAPPELIGREAELAAMTAFCTDAAAGEYVCWRAAPWTGKTALMSTFVLDPPAGVQVVSFFVTARYAGNSDRAAYVEAVNEQLAALVGHTVPPYLTPAAQTRLYWSLLDRAAARCAGAGQRLLLVVDGLDEDRGVTTGPDAGSIAALLPAKPPAGMRVVVAGRPDPPVPADVPAGHPLRDPERRWMLRGSEHAATIHADMLADLSRLRDGTAVERDVLGLVTAAGGGLASRDLAELSQRAGHEVTDWDIERLLATVAGRSFSSRDRRWAAGTQPPVYVLGHEEIQQESARAYGPVQLGRYRERLHEWAGLYRASGWPPDTPEYLLRGYFDLLLGSGDLTRAVGCVTDLVRHDRMLDLSGGDTAALVEITKAQNLILAAPAPDLAALARLAFHRGRLASRNSEIPPGLPAVWARLGQADRAEQLARAITEPAARALALIRLAAALAEVGDAERVAGDAEQVAYAVTDVEDDAAVLAGLTEEFARLGHHDRARRLAAHAARVVGADVEPHRHQRALSGLAVALARAGDRDGAEEFAYGVSDPSDRTGVLTDLVDALADHHDRAERIARTISGSYQQAKALGGVAKALAEAGAGDRAEQIARSITDPYLHVMALTRLAGVSAEIGDLGRARRLTGEVNRLAPTIAHRESRVRMQIEIAEVLARTGETDRARAAADDAERHSRQIAGRFSRARLTIIVGVVARIGDYDRAIAIARSIAAPYDQMQALSEVVTVCTEAGDYDRAERLARTMRNHEGRELSGIAAALTRAGDFDRAERLALSIDPPDAAPVLEDLAVAMARAGEWDRAEQLATGIPDRHHRAAALRGAAQACTVAGEYERAERLARIVGDPGDQAEALSGLAHALLGIDGDRTARRMAAEAERLARGTTRSYPADRVVRGLANALAVAGDVDRAEQLAGGLTGEDRAPALSDVAMIIAQTGDGDRAERLARTITDPYHQGRALLVLAVVLARAGDHDRAERLATGLRDRDVDVASATNLARVFVRAGELDRAERLAGILGPAARSRVLQGLAEALLEAGELDRAERIANEAPGRSEGVQALAGLAVAVARAGDPDRVRRTVDQAGMLARTIADAGDRARALTVLAGALARIGDSPGAERLVRVIRDQNYRERAIAGIVAALIEAGDHDDAEQFARRAGRPAHVIGSSESGLKVLGDLAIAFAGANQGARAEEVLRTMPPSPLLAQVTFRIALTFVEVGDLGRAERAARDIRDPDDQANVLSRLAEGLARAGDHHRAGRLALSIGRPQFRAYALFGVAASHPDRARRLIATALCETFLEDLPLDRLSSSAPEVLRSLFEAVVSRPVSPDPPR